MEHAPNNRNNTPNQNRGRNDSTNRGRGGDRGRGRGQQNRAHGHAQRTNQQEERPWTVGQLRAWLVKMVDTNPDQILSRLTGNEESKLKNALNGKVIFEGDSLPLLMLKLLTLPDLMDHIRSMASNGFYSMVMETKFLTTLASYLRLGEVSLDVGGVEHLIRLVTHLLNLSPQSIIDVEPLIDFLIKNSSRFDTNTAISITNLVTRRDYALEQRKLKNSRTQEERAEGDFREIPLFPSKDEMFASPKAKYLRRNKVEGQPYEDLDDYLDTHFRLLHEDAFADIRKAVFNLHQGNVIKRMSGVKVYEHVLAIGVRLDDKGMFFQMNIGTNKKVNWARSKSLMTGSLLCMSCDGFASDLIWATIAARDEKKLAQGKIEIELAAGYDANFHTGKEYTIIEASSAYFEAFAPVLRALQSKTDNVPFQDYLLKYSKVIAPPKYLGENTALNRNDFWDVSIAFPHAVNRRMHLLQPWPETSELGPTVDSSQLAALQQILTKEFAIVQGPPGTGKTYIGLQAARLMLANGAPTPILCVCYTNHALDQFLEGIYKFEDKILRLGGRSKSELMQNECGLFSPRWNRAMHGDFFRLRKELLALIEQLKTAIMDLAHKTNQPYATLDQLSSVFTSKQIASLSKGPGKKLNRDRIVQAWVTQTEKKKPTNGKAQNNNRGNNNTAARANNTNANRNFIEDVEDEDEDELNDEMDEEALEDLLAEREEAEFEEEAPVNREAVFNVQPVDYMTVDELDEIALVQMVNSLKHVENLWAVDVVLRKSIHDIVLKVNRSVYGEKLTDLYKRYATECRKLKELNNMRTMALLRQANVIGMTTTAAAKNVELLRALKPKIVIVEEAAEVLEAHIITALTKDTQHLILIGDHQQLRPSTAVYDLSKRYNLDVSLFERMTKNKVPFKRLSTQRRMRPEISQLISPIYQQLYNHPTVANHPRVVNGIQKNLFFLDHNVLENTSGDSTSKFNDHEVMLVSNLCMYLVQQGYKPDKITVLTMYLQQLFRIKEQLKVNANYNPDCGQIRVSSVDNYQGEENDIIILSLVRSNTAKSIGFLQISNRVCVALSRARNAFYMFGNGQLLKDQSPLWQSVITLLQKQDCIGTSLTLCCQNHPKNLTLVKTGLDIREKAKDGGCTLPCTHRLDCGHSCKKFCHPDGHDTYICYEPCARLHACGHSCGKRCFDECGECTQLVPVTVEPCQHEMMVPCNKSALPVVCTKPCEKKFACGHRCPAECGKKCPLICRAKVTMTLPCAHGAQVQCHQRADPYSVECPRPCQATLECGHPCPGTCGKCKNGHQKCTKPCKRTLVCNHSCTNACEKSCAPCTQKCKVVCKHSRCDNKCSEPCAPCNEPCAWSCPHHKCTKLCWEICTRPRCDEPCRKMLKCRHRCIGLCGETCPALCRVCDIDGDFKDSITLCSLEEAGEDARYIQLDCKHIFDVAGLDDYIGTEASNNSIKYLSCPECKSPIQTTLRYSTEIKRRLLDIERVKAKVLASKMVDEGIVQYQKQIYAAAKKLFANAATLDPQNTDILMKLAQTELALTLFVEAEKVLNKLLKIEPNHKQAKEMLENCTQERCMKEVVKAMSNEIKKGGWYKCPNGHLYAIGECGGAMQESTCPECGARIGGTSHQLNSGNSRSNIDGGEG